MSEKEVRQALGAYLFGGAMAARRVKDLSGGEKARLVLCELLCARPNFLVLDEADKPYGYTCAGNSGSSIFGV